MKTFVKWAEETKKELPLFTQDENTKRSGIARWAYPSAYITAQYPLGYFMPVASDAAQKLGIGKVLTNSDK